MQKNQKDNMQNWHNSPLKEANFQSVIHFEYTHKFPIFWKIFRAKSKHKKLDPKVSP